MLDHAARLESAHASVSVICDRTDAELALAVPNCPPWTIYNAAVHVGRVGVAWKSMISAAPDDPFSRARGYADAEARGSGQPASVLASWARAGIDALRIDEAELDGLERPALACRIDAKHRTAAVEVVGQRVAR